jgi:hypothetical protein
MYGWGNGQIKVMAALHLKNHVQARVEQCLLRDNEICFRLCGETGKRGGALVTIMDCTRPTPATWTWRRVGTVLPCLPNFHYNL